MSVTDNIEKHAGAPLYPTKLTHPHQKYSQYQRLKIFSIVDPQIKRLHDMYLHNSTNPLDEIKVRDIVCPCDDKILYEQIFGSPTDQPEEVMAYKSCKHTIFAAAKRQMKAAPTPDEEVAKDFVEYAKNIINEEIGEDLTHFGYSYQQWYSHLNKKKQNDMDLVAKWLSHYELKPAELRRVLQRNYEGICKVELQSTDGKPRMVCSIPLYTKFVMGPVCWMLEEVCAKKFRGYCGGKNLIQMSNQINEYLDQGFTKIVEGDGSAFDNTQDVSLKEVDRYIYSLVEHAIYHVDRQDFHEISQSLFKTMDILYTDQHSKKQKKLFSYTILGSVFSGDCDTTLCNTLRMALYNRYVNDRAGLKYGVDYVCFAKGDDFTVMYKDYVKNDFIEKAYYKYFLPACKDLTKPDTRIYGLGQVLKMLDFGDASSLKFCSLRSWFKDGQHIILTRDPKKFFTLSKYSRKIKCMTKIQKAKYCIEQAIALEVAYPGIKIFDTMAQAYRIRAKQYLWNNNKVRIDENQLKESILKKMTVEVKMQESPYMPRETRQYRDMFNIKYRQEVIKIQADYWETMKQHMYNVSYKLNEKELQLINQQIEAEFSTEELKSVLGPGKF